MKTRVRPIPRAIDIAVFYRVVMDIVEVLSEILFILQRVFPIAGLPDAAADTPRQTRYVCRWHSVLPEGTLNQSADDLPRAGCGRAPQVKRNPRQAQPDLSFLKSTV